MYLLIPILVGFAVLCLGGAALTAQAARRSRILERLSAGTVGADPIGPAAPHPLAGAIYRIGGTLSRGKASRTLKEELARAGFYRPEAPAIFIGLKMILLIVGLTGALSLGGMLHWAGPRVFMACLCIAGVAFFVPNIVLDLRRKSRQQEIGYHLPDAIDLLEIAVSAGMGIDQAWNSVADEVRTVSPHLADEMALTNLEIHLGETRTAAMRHMAERTGAGELSSLVACLLQSERFGTSVGDALRRFAMGMREARSQRAQEAAEKMAVKLIFPMILFVFPPVVMVMAGPAIMALMKALSGQE